MTTSISASSEVNPRLKALTEAGVSVWLDEISRGSSRAASSRGSSSCNRCAASRRARRSSRTRSDYQDEIETMAVGGADARTICDALAMRTCGLRPTCPRDPARRGWSRRIRLTRDPAQRGARNEGTPCRTQLWAGRSRPNRLHVPGTRGSRGNRAGVLRRNPTSTSRSCSRSRHIRRSPRRTSADWSAAAPAGRRPPSHHEGPNRMDLNDKTGAGHRRHQLHRAGSTAGAGCPRSSRVGRGSKRAAKWTAGDRHDPGTPAAQRA